jgi:hypothetical protein
MATSELLAHFEAAVGWDEEMLHHEENPLLAEYVTELRAVWEHRSVLRHIRYMAEIQVCNGDGHRLETPTARCMDGKHETCPAHTDSSYLCLPFGETR